MGIGGRPGYRRATVVGGGVIGISWTALFLAHGLEVTVCDPLPDVAERVRAGLREIAPTLAQLGLPVDDLTDSTDALRFDPDLASAVAGTDVVQENGPERPEVKQQLWSTIEGGAPATALLASSSSGIPASVMSQTMRRPGRLIIGHPFNPPHLVPLVEVVPSPGTDPEVVEAAVAFYRAMGKQPQVLSREIPGFVANRLQAALFREAVYLVAQGVVTEQELDAVVTSSIGMRWAVAGPFQTFHLGGGPGGLADFIVHLGPGLEGLWAILGQARLDADTTRLLTTQAEHFGGTVAELATRRDQAQIRLMQALGELGAADQQAP
jgi:ketoreductase RED1